MGSKMVSRASMAASPWAAMTLATLLALGCSGGSNRPTLKQCVVNSDCPAPLVCPQGYCVAQCVVSRDCASDQNCIIVPGFGNVCQAPPKKSCVYNSDCDPLWCGPDHQCRNQCVTDRDCTMGQQCTTITKVCFDPVKDAQHVDSSGTELTPTGAGGAGGLASPGSSGGHAGGAAGGAMGPQSGGSGGPGGTSGAGGIGAGGREAGSGGITTVATGGAGGSAGPAGGRTGASGGAGGGAMMSASGGSMGSGGNVGSGGSVGGGGRGVAGTATGGTPASGGSAGGASGTGGAGGGGTSSGGAAGGGTGTGGAGGGCGANTQLSCNPTNGICLCCASTQKIMCVGTTCDCCLKSQEYVCNGPGDCSCCVPSQCSTM